jgi:hypothetical protein
MELINLRHRQIQSQNKHQIFMKNLAEKMKKANPSMVYSSDMGSKIQGRSIKYIIIDELNGE